MPTEEVQVSPSELTQIIESVFLAQVGLEIAASSVPWLPDPLRLTAAVHMAGSWNGAVRLECDRAQACQLTGRFLAMMMPGAEAPLRVDEVVRDTLGELVNMIGGNLKCVLTPGILLSLPVVVEGHDFCLPECRCTLRERLAFESEVGVFWVTVMAKP